MLKEGKFGVTEAICLVTITCTVKIFFTSPAVLVKHVGTAAWYVTLISATTALIGFSFIYLLLKRFPGKNLPEIFDLTLSRAGGFLFSLIIAAFLMIDAGIFLREFSDVLRSYTFPSTSTSYIIGALVITVGLAAWLGLETIARVSKLAAYFLLAAFMALLIFGSREYHFDNLYPLLGYGLGKSVFIGTQRCSVYAEVIVLGISAASLQGIKNIKRAGVVSISLSGFLIALGLLAEVLMFSYTAAQAHTAPMYALARVIKYGDFFSRLDPLFIILWSIATVITISVLFYAAVSIFCQTMRLPDKRPVVIPLAVILYSLALAPRDFSTIVYGLIESARRFNWTAFFGLPLVALISAAVRNKRGGAADA
jgi:spore germination protein (amino acid permease)